MHFEPNPSPSCPTSLPALEHHLEARLLELEKLHQTRPGLPTAMARAQAGQRIDDLLDEIAELQRMIDASPAVTLGQEVQYARPFSKLSAIRGRAVVKELMNLWHEQGQPSFTTNDVQRGSETLQRHVNDFLRQQK